MSSCYVELREPREVSFLRARAMEAGYRIVPKSARIDSTILTDKDKVTGSDDDSSPELTPVTTTHRVTSPSAATGEQLTSRRVEF